MSSQVLGSSTVQTPSRDHAEFIFDTLGYVEPMKLHMYELRQAAVDLPGTTDHTFMFMQVVIRKPADLTDAFFSVGKIAASAPVINIIIIMVTCKVVCFCAGTSGRTCCNMSTNNDISYS